MKKLDADGSGWLPRDEFKRALRAYGCGIIDKVPLHILCLRRSGRRIGCPPPPPERPSVEHISAGTGGAPRDRSSTGGQRDNCPTLTYRGGGGSPQEKFAGEISLLRKVAKFSPGAILPGQFHTSPQLKGLCPLRSQGRLRTRLSQPFLAKMHETRCC